MSKFSEASKKIEVLEVALTNSNYHQKSLLELSDQVSTLLEKQTMYERKTTLMN